jgi:hypothetical protein
MRILSLTILIVFSLSLNGQTNSPHGSAFKVSCKTCHSSKGWQLDKAIYSFDHNKTKFPLTGQHTLVSCRLCHPTLVFSAAKTNCIDCHKDIHQATVGPDCIRCHTTVTWLVTNINDLHMRSRFPLLGSHRLADCSQCHKSESLLRFDAIGINCVDCHLDKYLATTNPNHASGGISRECSLCHSVSSPEWGGAGFVHSTFPLQGGHSGVKCTDCHKTSGFTGLSTECNSCHQQDFLAAKNPDHTASKFEVTCQDCHSLNPGWKPATFTHSNFSLALGHSSAACIDCHIGGNYKTTSSACYSCHQKDFVASKNPNHSDAGFSQICQDCHSLNPGWKPATFGHASFPLTLGHAIPACADCHKGNYTAISVDCYSCHQKDFTAATNPNHVSSGIPTTCKTCHTTNPGWSPATFNHTAFPLTLGHSTPACNDCHKGNYTTTSSVCYSCHQADYTGATNPNHVASGIPTTCNTCHSTNPGWAPAAFSHTTFPLTLGHSTPTCNDCHKGNYTTTSNVCYSCHQADYTGATNPNHVTSGIPTTCNTCHTTNPGWAPAAFSHTTFPLTLGHSTPTCNDCHKGNYTTTSNVCYSCHQADYTGATNPNHVTSGIPNTCNTCHTTNPGWTPATFTHTNFPLTQGHATPTCNDCHKGNYTTTSNVCYSCHTTDYNNTTNPNHNTLGFSTTCTQCHTTLPGWKPATYTQHDTQFFPIYSGRHLGQWTTCSDCHTTATNYTLFDCKHCHTTVHRTNNYTNAQCYSCHPKGIAD